MWDLNGDRREILGNNLAALQKVWEIPLELEPSPEGWARVQLEDRAGQWHLRVKLESGQWVAVHGRRPDEEAAAWWRSHSVAQADIRAVILIGAGLGYGIQAALVGHPHARVLVVEHEPALALALLAARDWRPWIEQRRLGVLIGPGYVGLPDLAAAFASDDVPPLVLSHPVLTRACRADAVAAATAVRRLVSDGRHNRGARAAFAKRYLLNTLTNLGEILAGGRVVGLDHLGAGTAAVVAGAGPSLNRNIDELRPLRGRAIVIAAGSAMRPLLASGIEPDVLVALDPADINARNLAGTARDNRTWLVAEGSLPPNVFREFHGRTIAFRVGDNHPWPWLRSLGLDPGRLRAWGSVITASFDLALRMGCNPIVFVGADHGYTGGQPYCRHTTWEDDWREREQQGMSLEEVWRSWKEARPVIAAQDLQGKTSESAGHLLAYRDWLVDASVRAAPVRIINATGAGMLWGGRVEIMPLEDALTGHSKVDFPTARELKRRTTLEPDLIDRVITSVTDLAATIGGERSPSVLDLWARDVSAFDPVQARAALLAGVMGGVPVCDD